MTISHIIRSTVLLHVLSVGTRMQILDRSHGKSSTRILKFRFISKRDIATLTAYEALYFMVGEWRICCCISNITFYIMKIGPPNVLIQTVFKCEQILWVKINQLPSWNILIRSLMLLHSRLNIPKIYKHRQWSTVNRSEL